MFKILKKGIKPFRLVTLVAMYVLGAGLVQYVQSLQIGTGIFQGVIFLILISISLELLRLLNQLRDVRQWKEDADFKEIRQTHWLIAITAAVLMTVATTLFINWMVAGTLWLGLIILVVIQLIVGALYYLSDTISSLRPYQLLFESLFYLTIPPAFAFFLQSDEMHLFLTLVVVGFLSPYFALRLLNQLKNFGYDQKYDNKTFVVRIGWDLTMTFHNTLILLTFVILALTSLLGFPWFILWPVFLVLPIGLLEIFLMERVRHGGKPYWVVMEIAAASVFFLPIYLIGFAFWVR